MDTSKNFTKLNREIIDYSFINRDSIYNKDVSNEKIVINKNTIEQFNDIKVLIKAISNGKDLQSKLNTLQKLKSLYKSNNSFSFTDLSSFIFTKNITKKLLTQLTDEELISIITEFYHSRIEMYESYGLNIDASILQVLSDEHSSRRKSKTGQHIIELILRDNGFTTYSHDKGNIESKEYTINEFEIEKLIHMNNIKFKSSIDDFGKLPDFLFKIENIIFIGEHKILKESGGAQDKQIKELINFIKYNEINDKNNVIYISIMEGQLFQTELVKEKYYVKLMENINNTDNFFCNKEGFKWMIDNIS